MRRSASLLRIALGVGALAVVVLSARNLPAGFHVEAANTTVEIDGVDYGRFDQIEGINLTASPKADHNETNKRITLRRDFVTDPSLYQWARNISNQRQGLKDIHLVKRDADGQEIARFVLKLCQPLSWTVEAANPALGGFHETVEFAVQEVEIR